MILLPCAGTALTLAGLLSQSPVRREYAGRQGGIVSDAPPAVAKEWVERLDRFCGVYERFYRGIGLEKRSDNKLRVRLFASFDAFKEFKDRDSPDGSAIAYFSPSLNSVVMYHDASDPWLAHTLFHEMQHQYLARYTTAAPKWVNEGLSEYFEGWRIGEDGSFESRPNLYDLLLLRNELKRNKGLPLADLARMSPREFQEFPGRSDLRGYLQYATSWGLVYYFLELASPKERAIFEDYLRALNAKGVKAERAAMAVPDWDEFEARWKRAILDLKATCTTRDEFLQVAAGHRRNGDHLGAIAAYRDALALDPNTPGVHYWLGYCLAAIGQDADALRELETARSDDGKDPRPSYLMARLAAGVDRKVSKANPVQALALAKEAFERSGKTNVSYLAFVAVCQDMNGDAKAALQTMSQVLKMADEEERPKYEELRDKIQK